MTAGRVDRGGEFLLTGAAGKRIFTPGDFPPDRRQIAWTAEEFVRKEILPDLDRMERRDFPLVVEKMRRCAGLGLQPRYPQTCDPPFSFADDGFDSSAKVQSPCGK